MYHIVKFVCQLHATVFTWPYVEFTNEKLGIIMVQIHPTIAYVVSTVENNDLHAAATNHKHSGQKWPKDCCSH